MPFLGCDYHRQYADRPRSVKEAHADADQSRFDGHGSERHVDAPLSDLLAPLHFRQPSTATEIAVHLLRVHERRRTGPIPNGFHLVDVGLGRPALHLRA